MMRLWLRHLRSVYANLLKNIVEVLYRNVTAAYIVLSVGLEHTRAVNRNRANLWKVSAQ
jgi:hypothetical protein